MSGDVIMQALKGRMLDVHTVTGWAVAHGARLDSLSVTRPTLEDVFLGLADLEPPA